MDIEIELYSDSSSAIAFSKRRGLGKNRHIATRYLWLQERIALKHLKVLKVGTYDNPADLFTKCLTQVVADRHGKRLGQFTKTIEYVHTFRLDENEPDTENESD